MRGDAREDGRKVVKYLFVADTEHMQATGGQDTVAGVVVLGLLVMDIAVNLHN